MVRPSLYHIGEKWQANQCTVASEHLATVIAQSVMTMGLLRSPPPEAIDKRVLLACAAGNEHSLGLRMVAMHFNSLNGTFNTLALTCPPLQWLGRLQIGSRTLLAYPCPSRSNCGSSSRASNSWANASAAGAPR